MVKAKSIFLNMKKPDIFFRKLINRLPSGIKRWLLRFESKAKISRDLSKIAEMYKGKMVFIFPFPNCPWGYMFQRPQQLARAIARKGYPVFYVVDTSFPHAPDWYIRGVQEIEKGLYLYNDGLASTILMNQLNSFDLVVVWQYWPHQLQFVNRLSEHCPIFKIYDCIDHLTTFDQYAKISTDYVSSIESSDLALATSNTIFREIKSIHQNVMLVPNGVCVEDFIPTKNMNSFDINHFKKNYKYIVGYYGAVAEWFDFKLISYLAEKNNDCLFLFVGELYLQVEKRARELQQECSNVVFMPRVNYTQIPMLLSQFDIAILPFVINDITLSTSPVKVFEYLAGGKPFISTDLPEVRQINVEYVATSPEEFHIKLRNFAENSESEQNRDYRIDIAKKHSWDEKTMNVLNRIKMVRG
ncbi:glycosyltransferase [Paenibacillus thiaminolyticus]|uniref:glycosyltransferase n=1 Tax=Paenibacillus thiaminolyticus TaxID=49283 RepID=UPI00232EC150|nr:glycosyltransferase [Paenibacillus thiaminolyticus]WCF07872.1 glycosyltransferase [Paenibacillus thiaminolyticus]